MQDGSVRAQLLARIDEITGRMAALLEEVRTVTEQLHPVRARSCRNAITVASAMVDEIRLRAHAPPPRRAQAVTGNAPAPVGVAIPCADGPPVYLCSPGDRFASAAHPAPLVRVRGRADARPL
jgi:hypothetical protein